MAFRALLDACVLVPAALRDTLLRAGEAYLYQPLWSELILAETKKTLVNALGVSAADAADLTAAMREAFPDAVVTGFEDLIPAMTVDPQDRHVAAAAIVGHAQVIVTLNPKLPRRPGELAAVLGDLDRSTTSTPRSPAGPTSSPHRRSPRVRGGSERGDRHQTRGEAVAAGTRGEHTARAPCRGGARGAARDGHDGGMAPCGRSERPRFTSLCTEVRHGREQQ